MLTADEILKKYNVSLEKKPFLDADSILAKYGVSVEEPSPFKAEFAPAEPVTTFIKERPIEEYKEPTDSITRQQLQVEMRGIAERERERIPGWTAYGPPTKEQLLAEPAITAGKPIEEKEYQKLEKTFLSRVGRAQGVLLLKGYREHLEKYPEKIGGAAPESFLDSFIKNSPMGLFPRLLGIEPRFARVETEALRKKHPVASRIGRAGGDLMTLVATSQIGGAVTKGIALAGRPYEMVFKNGKLMMRLLSYGAGRGVMWGLKGFLGEAAQQRDKEEYSVKNLLKETSYEGAYGLIWGTSLAIPKAYLRITSAGAGRMAYDTARTLIEKHKITKENLLSISLNGAMSAILASVGARTAEQQWKARTDWTYGIEASKDPLLQKYIGKIQEGAIPEKSFWGAIKRGIIDIKNIKAMRKLFPLGYRGTIEYDLEGNAYILPGKSHLEMVAGKQMLVPNVYKIPAPQELKSFLRIVRPIAVVELAKNLPPNLAEATPEMQTSWVRSLIRGWHNTGSTTEAVSFANKTFQEILPMLKFELPKEVTPPIEKVTKPTAPEPIREEIEKIKKEYPGMTIDAEKEAVERYEAVAKEPLPEVEKTEKSRIDNLIERVDRLYEEPKELTLGNIMRAEASAKLAEKALRGIGKKEWTEKQRIAIEKTTKKLKEIIGRPKYTRKQRVEINKMYGKLQGISKKVEKMSAAQKKPIKDLLNNIDLITKYPMRKTIMKLTNTTTYLLSNPQAEVPDYVMDDLKRLDKKNMRDVTLDELKSVYMGVMAHINQELTKTKIKVGRETRELLRTLNDSIGEMRLPKKIQTDIVQSQAGRLKRVKHVGTLIKDTFGIRSDHYDLITETLAGQNSMMDKVFYQSPKEGVNAQLRYRHGAIGQYQKDVNIDNFIKKYKTGNLAKWLNQRIKVGKFNLTRNERMALYRHSLNDNNLRHILYGGIGLKFSNAPYEHHKMSVDNIQNIINSLTPAEKEFAGKAATNLFERQYNKLNEVFTAVNGYDLPKEDFYYPIDVMTTELPTALEQRSILEDIKQKFVRIGLRKGMLEQRRKSKLPIYLNGLTYDINRSIYNSAAYIGLEIPLRNASKLLYNKTFKTELLKRYGRQTYIEIDKGLRDIAGDWQSYTTVQELLIRGKNKLATAILGISFAIPKQILSYALYSTYVKPQYLIQGFIDFWTHPHEVIKKHKIYSAEYKERAEGGYSRDVADIFKTGAEKRLYKGRKSLPEAIMGGIKLFDNFAVAPGMQGAVLQILAESKIGKLSNEPKIALDMSDKDVVNLSATDKMKQAYKFADYSTQRTQPMFSPEHRSSLSRGVPAEKLATMFTSFTNQALNLIRRNWRAGLRTKDPKIYAKLAKVLFLLFVVNTGGVMAINELRDRIYKRKRKPKGFIRKYGEAVLDSIASYIYFLRDLERSIMSKIEKGTWLGYDISIPILQFGNRIASAFANGIRIFTDKPENKRKNAIKFLDDVLYLIFTSQGLPYETPKKIGKGIITVEEGETSLEREKRRRLK